MRSIVVGTAGHIDHGKTALVRALTGTDADRLPEEKRRGITIDIGFAELTLPNAHVSFVDVPGHERFVKNMLAGAHGIDLVLLVIAADSGVMPQTREHFDICRLLNISQGLVVITKVDMVDAELCELVRLEVEELVKGSFLDGAPVVQTSARTGEGLAELKDELQRLAQSVPVRTRDAVARLPVDRVFSVRGFGTVVTGTLIAGEIGEGDEMELLPAKSVVRVRGVQAHNQTLERALPGNRTAVNLGGIEQSAVERGQVLASAGALRETQIFDAEIEMLASAARGLRSRQRVRVHAGTAEILARVQVLEDAGEVAAGERSFVQLRLESPVVVLQDDRFVVRSYSPARTIAGGRVIDPLAVKYRARERVAARERLAELLVGEACERARIFIEAAGDHGLHRADLIARTGWLAETLERHLDQVRDRFVEAEGVLIDRQAFDGLVNETVKAVEEFQRKEPLARGLLREALRERVFAHHAPEIFRHVLNHAECIGKLIIERDAVRAVAHEHRFSEKDARLRERLKEIYTSAGLEAPTLDEALKQSEVAASALAHGRKIAQTLIDEGVLVRVREDLLMNSAIVENLIADLRARVAETAKSTRPLDVALFKEVAGVSRKYAIPLLEYLDRRGVTRRAGDARFLT